MKTQNSIQDLYQREAQRMQAHKLAQAGWMQNDIKIPDVLCLDT